MLKLIVKKVYFIEALFLLSVLFIYCVDYVRVSVFVFVLDPSTF